MSTRPSPSEPARATLAVSGPGAPPEPQRTTPAIGVAREVYAALLRTAAGNGLLAQEALEPTTISVPSHEAVARLVTGALDVAIVDLATFLGERALGWDGLAIAAFGPAPDRSVGVAIVERSTWTGRRDLCDRLVRACVRARQRLADVPADPAAAWWPTCRPSAEEIDEVARGDDALTTTGLADGLAWHSSPGDPSADPVTAEAPMG